MHTIFSKWWNYAAATTVVLGIVIVGAVPASSQDEQPDSCYDRLKLLEKPEQTLTVDETLGVVFDPQYGVSPRKFYARANPEAKEALYRILDNEELNEFHGKAWEILGYIGGEAHVQRVEEAVEEFKSIPRTVTRTEHKTLLALFRSLGVMCGREIGRACEAAEKMMQPMYWRNAKFRWDVNLESQQQNTEHYTIRRVMYGFSLSLDPEIEKYVQSALKTVDDPKQREKLAPNPEGLLASGWNTRSREEERVTREERREMASFFNGDLQNPGPARPPRYIDPGPPAGDEAEKEGVPPPESDFEQLKRIAHEVSLNADGCIASVTLHGEEITNETLNLLRAAPQLRLLRLISTAVTDEGLKHLQSLNNLQYLKISRSTRITPRGMKHVGQLTGLIHLDLHYLPNLTDKGIEALRSLEKLQFLRLAKLPITDAALEHVASLPNLRTLRISDAPIKGLGLHHLRNQLTDLSLAGAPLIDHGLAYLHDMDRLEKLSLGPGGGASGYVLHLTDEAVEELQEALPETEVRYSRGVSGR